MNDLLINQGSILVYRVFDIADEIDLVAVEKALHQEKGKSRLEFVKKGRYAVVMRNAPIRLELGEIPLKIKNETVQAKAFATVWDYGVLSIVFQIPIQIGTSWRRLVTQASVIYGEVEGGEDIDIQARNKSREICQLIKNATKGLREWDVYEDYVIYFLQEVQGIETAADLLKKVDVPSLLLGEHEEKLSNQSREAILENTFQYSDRDICVLDWNSAVILEPSGNRDISDVIEFAVTHLLEVRFYDNLLDEKLSKLYDAIEVERHGVLRNQFSKIMKEANTRFIDFSEFFERIDNSLKVVGDIYLAVIFRAAVRRFRIQDWQQDITRKMNIMARVSELLQGEINTTRGHWLELVIIFLIAFEILSKIVESSIRN
jgi:hypothetical protein